MQLEAACIWVIRRAGRDRRCAGLQRYGCGLGVGAGNCSSEDEGYDEGADDVFHVDDLW